VTSSLSYEGACPAPDGPGSSDQIHRAVRRHLERGCDAVAQEGNDPASPIERGARAKLSEAFGQAGLLSGDFHIPRAITTPVINRTNP
jgi:hypothetical protein